MVPYLPRMRTEHEDESYAEQLHGNSDPIRYLQQHGNHEDEKN